MRRLRETDRVRQPGEESGAGTVRRIGLLLAVVLAAGVLASTAAAAGPAEGGAVNESDAGNATDAPSTVLSLARERAPGANISVLTADGLTDTRPSIAPTEDGYVVVWQRQMGSKSRTAGQDIFYATYENGEWSSPRPLTDNHFDDFMPEVAYDEETGQVVAVWTQVGEDFRGEDPQAGEVIKEMEVVYATYDGTSWSTPTYLTSNEAADASPRIAGNGGRFLVAWAGDGDGNVNTSDAVVRHARITGTTHGSIGAIDRRTPPRVVAPGPDGRFRVGFFVPEGGQVGRENGTLLVLDGVETFDRAFRREVTGFRGIGLHGDAVAWATGEKGGSSIHYVEGDGEPRRVPTAIDTQSIHDLALHSARGSPLLTYRGAPINATGRRLMYLLRHEGRWVYEHDLNTTASEELTFAQTAVATREDSFGAVFVGHERSRPKQNNDLFAVVHRFRPDLTVAVDRNETNTNASIGDQVSVPYTVRNIGEVPLGDSFEVSLVSGSEVLATTTHEGLGVGGNLTGSLSAAVPESGRIDVRVDPKDRYPEVSERNNRVRLQYGTRDVAAVTYRTLRADAGITVVTTVENVGTVALENVGVQFGTRNRSLGETSIASLAPGESTEVRFTIPMAIANSTTGARVRAVATGDTNSLNDGLGVDLLHPEVGLFDRSIEFVNRDGRLVAEVLVVNDGSTLANFTLEARGPDGEVIGSVRGIVPPATSGSNVGTTQVSVELPASVSGKRVTFVAAVRADPDNADNAVRVQVPSLPGIDSTPPTVRSFRANATDGGVEVRVTASEQLDALTVSVSGPESVTLTAEDFERKGTGYTYVATASVDAGGTYTATLDAAADAAGNAANTGQTATADVGGSGGGLPILLVVVLLVVAGGAVAYRLRG